MVNNTTLFFLLDNTNNDEISDLLGQILDIYSKELFLCFSETEVPLFLSKKIMALA